MVALYCMGVHVCVVAGYSGVEGAARRSCIVLLGTTAQIEFDIETNEIAGRKVLTFQLRDVVVRKCYEASDIKSGSTVLGNVGVN